MLTRLRVTVVVVLVASAVAAAVVMLRMDGPTNARQAFRIGQMAGTGPAFGADGAITTDFNRRWDDANAVVVQPDGKLLVAGESSAPKEERAYFALSRYLNDGRRDPGFGTDGRVTTDLGSGDGGANDALLLPDGRIVAVGVAGRSFEDEGMGVARYLPDGSLDPSFGGGDGWVNIDHVEYSEPGNDCLRATAVALQPEKKLVVMGTVGCGGEGGGTEGAVVRLHPDGQLDRSFDRDGTQTFNFGHCAFGNDVAVQADGKILVAGGDGGCDEKRSQFGIARLHIDGTIDRSFGRGGRQKVAFAAPNAWVEDMISDRQGRVLLVGSAGGKSASRFYRYTFALARLTPTGALDRSFGRSGTRTAPTDLPRPTTASAGALHPRGRIIVVGTMSRTWRDSEAVMAVYRSNGDLDRSFGRRGVSRVRFGGPRNWANAVTVDASGRIVVAGETHLEGTSADFGVARFASG